MTLRTKLSLVLSILLVGSIGATGAILIYESGSHSQVELRDKHKLLAENRAFALRDNFEILENELDRLDPKIDFGDKNPLPEEQLLEHSHQNSALYNTGVLLLDARGECVFAVPASSGYKGQNFADRPWFQSARATPRDFQFFPTNEPLTGRTLKIVRAHLERGRFAGALVGIIALGNDNLITPSLKTDLRPHTAAILVDLNGHVVYPEEGVPAPGSGWDRAIELVRNGSGTLRASAAGEDSLFAFAPVRGGTPYAVVFRWPWSSLTAPVRHQVWALVGILVFGIAMAAAVGLMLSSYLTRPIRTLAVTAQRIGRGEYPELRPTRDRSDEIGTLEHAFAQMGEQVRQRVEERTRELERAQQALVEAERFAAMGKTSAAIAHELKNAMGGIGMAVDLILQDPANTNRVARLRKQVVAEIARLRDVVDELLSFSRAPRIERSEQDLAAIVRQAVEVLADTIADRGATVEVDAPAPLPVHCDGHRVQGAVMNLVKNAVEAGTRVRVRATAQNGEAIVEVTDDGPGLTADARLHLFEPFFTTKPNGTGLGLPTSRRFIEAHGGTIEAAQGAELGGALFRLRLPREVA